MSDGVVYEVNLSVDREVEAAFRRWLVLHVEDMLEFDGFVSAEVFEVSEAGSERLELCTHYRLKDRASLDDYLTVHAERMRGEGFEHFGSRFSATRRILDSAFSCNAE